MLFGKLKEYKNQLDGRSMLVKKTSTIPIECVVRGYLSGSGWKEYKKTNSVSGIKLKCRQSLHFMGSYQLWILRDISFLGVSSISSVSSMRLVNLDS